MNASALQSAKLIINHFIRTLTGKTKKGINVVGAGGHAKVCIELLREMGYRVDYCIGTELDEDVCIDVPVLRGDHYLDRLHEQGYTHVFIAIGNGKLRQRLAILAKDKGFTLVNAISSSAKISASARLGEGIAIMSGVVINADARIGDYAIINTGASVDHDCTIEESTHMHRSVLWQEMFVSGNIVF